MHTCMHALSAELLEQRLRLYDASCVLCSSHLRILLLSPLLVYIMHKSVISERLHSNEYTCVRVCCLFLQFQLSYVDYVCLFFATCSYCKTEKKLSSARRAKTFTERLHLNLIEYGFICLLLLIVYYVVYCVDS